MLFYRAALPLPRRTPNLAARAIRTHRRETGSRWRRLDPAQQALLVLVHLYKGEPFAQVVVGFEVDTTTAWCMRARDHGPARRAGAHSQQGLCRARRKGRGK
jgi:hypothetical protein